MSLLHLSRWWIAAIALAAVSAVASWWYVPRKRRSWVVYFLLSVAFGEGGLAAAMLSGRQSAVFFIVMIPLALGWWWRNVYWYYHERERYTTLLLPRTALWFVPLTFFLIMNGAWGIQIFFDTESFVQTLITLAAWSGLLNILTWFWNIEWRAIRWYFLAGVLAFVELSYVISFVPFTFFVRAAIQTVAFILWFHALRFVVGKGEHDSRRFMLLALVACAFLAVILATARWS